MECPRCLGKGHVDQADILRLGMETAWAPGPCLYCRRRGNVSEQYARKHDVRSSLWGRRSIAGDLIIVLAAIGVTVWGFTLPDVPIDPEARERGISARKLYDSIPPADRWLSLAASPQERDAILARQRAKLPEIKPLGQGTPVADSAPSDSNEQIAPLPQAAQLPAQNITPVESAHPFIAAIKAGDLNKAHTLIAKVIDINEEDEDGNTALMWAIRNNNVEAVKFLLQQQSISVTCRDHEGNSAISLALDNEEIFSLLKERGAVP